jgi:hypothetical protein
MKVRMHNEYFRRVFTTSKDILRYRDEELIQEILARPHNTLTEELLRQPYKSCGPLESSRKSCPTCKAKLLPNEFVWSWGEYRYGKWRTVTHFCSSCFIKEVRNPLLNHGNDCGCSIELVSYGGSSLPDWLTLEVTCSKS